jgi:hypothetical protein
LFRTRKQRIRLWGGLALVVALVIGVAASGEKIVFLGDLTDETVIIEREGADVIATWLEMYSGRMTIHGGTDAALEVNLRTMYKGDRPQSDYSVNYGVGLLQVSQQPLEDLVLLGGRRANEWDVRLGHRVPLGLAVGVHSRSNLEIDLRQNVTQNMWMTLIIDSSDLTLYLPEAVGTRITVDRRGGTVSVALPQQGDTAVYTSEAYGKARVRFEIEIISTGDSKVIVR